MDAPAAAGYRYDEVRLGCRWAVLKSDSKPVGHLTEQEEVHN